MRKALWIVPASVVGIACFIWAVLFLSYHMRPRDDVERRIGATIGSPYVTLDGRRREVIAFFFVEPDGPAAEAGINEGDIVLEDVSIAELCSRFRAPSGKRAVVEVVPGGDGRGLEQRERREVSVLLP